jgi:hypothetical protein
MPHIKKNTSIYNKFEYDNFDFASLFHSFKFITYKCITYLDLSYGCTKRELASGMLILAMVFKPTADP